MDNKDRKGKGIADDKVINVDDEPGTDEIYPTNETLSEGQTVATHGRNQSTTTGEDDKTEGHAAGTSSNAGPSNENKFRGKLSDTELAELAISNPQWAKRILNNRISRKRKADHTSQLEARINTLQSQLAASCAQHSSQHHQMTALWLQNQRLKRENQQCIEMITALTEEINHQVVQNVPFGVPQNLPSMTPQFYGMPRTINQHAINQRPSIWSAQQQQQQLQLSQAPHPPQPHVDQQPGMLQLQPSQTTNQHPHPPQPHQMQRPRAAREGDHDAGDEAHAPGQGYEQ